MKLLNRHEAGYREPRLAEVVAVLQFLHVAIGVSDPNASVNFYCDILGFDFVRKGVYEGDGPSAVMDVGDSEFSTHILNNGSLQIELICYVKPAPRPALQGGSQRVAGLSYLAVAIEDEQFLTDELTRRGIGFHRYPRDDQAEVGGPLVSFADPDGTTIIAFALRTFAGSPR